ncbi:hypothetical protein EV363DRAFT_1334049 [Boletus edulis]|nr:hypothetical protein EV363DRAFT_1334049 [Boletus edulis]
MGHDHERSVRAYAYRIDTLLRGPVAASSLRGRPAFPLFLLSWYVTNVETARMDRSVNMDHRALGYERTKPDSSSTCGDRGFNGVRCDEETWADCQDLPSSLINATVDQNQVALENERSDIVERLGPAKNLPWIETSRDPLNPLVFTSFLVERYCLTYCLD